MVTTALNNKLKDYVQTDFPKLQWSNISPENKWIAAFNKHLTNALLTQTLMLFVIPT